MLSFLANWKTTLAGIAALMTAAGHLLNSLLNGDTSSLATDLPMILASFGLIVAKDGSK